MRKFYGYHVFDDSFGADSFDSPVAAQSFFILNSALIIGAAYFIETHYFTASVFSYKTIMLFWCFS